VGTGALGKGIYLPGQGSQGIVISIVDGRHYQSSIGGYCYTKVNAFLDDDLVVFRPARVDQREFTNTLTHCLHHEWQVADAVAFAPFELFLVFLKPFSDVGHVDLNYCGRVWRGALAAYHVLGNCQAHAAGRYYLDVAFDGCCRRGKFNRWPRNCWCSW